mgnify:CR=1 FL=1
MEDYEMKDTHTFLEVLYRNVKDVSKRQDIIKLYFKEKDNDNNIGDC